MVPAAAEREVGRLRAAHAAGRVQRRVDIRAIETHAAVRDWRGRGRRDGSGGNGGGEGRGKEAWRASRVGVGVGVAVEAKLGVFSEERFGIKCGGLIGSAD